MVPDLLPENVLEKCGKMVNDTGSEAKRSSSAHTEESYIFSPSMRVRKRRNSYYIRYFY